MTSDSLCRIGFGSMQLTGPGHWGAADDPGQAMQVLREAVDAGVSHIDTADAYGPFTAEKYIRKALQRRKRCAADGSRRCGPHPNQRSSSAA